MAPVELFEELPDLSVLDTSVVVRLNLKEEARAELLLQEKG